MLHRRPLAFISSESGNITTTTTTTTKGRTEKHPEQILTPQKKKTEVKLTFFSFYFESNTSIFFPTKQRALIQTETGE